MILTASAMNNFQVKIIAFFVKNIAENLSRLSSLELKFKVSHITKLCCLPSEKNWFPLKLKPIKKYQSDGWVRFS